MMGPSRVVSNFRISFGVGGTKEQKLSADWLGGGEFCNDLPKRSGGEPGPADENQGFLAHDLEGGLVKGGEGSWSSGRIVLSPGHSFVHSASICEHPEGAGTWRRSQDEGDPDPALQKSRRERRRQVTLGKERCCQTEQERRPLWVLRGRAHFWLGTPTPRRWHLGGFQPAGCGGG